ncbi:MAG: hypothetical protein ACLQVN_14555 [Bryobacteraceae bacterium]
MRFLVAAVFAAGWVFAAAPLAIVQPAISIMEGGIPDAPGADHVPGETVYFSCRVVNYTKGPDDKVRLAYTVQAFDPAGVPLTEASHDNFQAEVAMQDKDWRPRIETEIVIPPLLPSGVYRITVKVDDLVAKTSAQLDVPLRVRGHPIQPGDALSVQNIRLFRAENDTTPVAKPAYRPGDVVWARFDIAGFQYGPGNKVDVSYLTALVAASGTVLWKQTEPAVERSESFYPKRYIPADFGLNLDKNIRPGEYTITITVKDGVGNQTCEARQVFTVE